MNAHDIISKIEARGLHLAVDGDDIIVTPPGQLTDQQRSYLKMHKASILAALRAHIIGNDQAGNDLEPANDAEPILARAWTPVGDLVLVKTDDQDHVNWIELMNPPPRLIKAVRCSACRHATISNGIARCGVGVDSGLPMGGFWATYRHLCDEHLGAEVGL